MARYVHPVLPFFMLASTACAAAAQVNTPAPQPLQQVLVNAPSATDQRRNDTASRLSVTREDIARYGDSNVSSLLKRQPGIAVVNGEVRMRGLGAGYTQILIDGEAAPQGFAIDSLAPSMIERIDLLRSGSAEFGAQGIAGTINIIMRKNHARPQRDLTLGVATTRGHLVNPSAALRWAGQHGQLAWSLGAELARTMQYYDETAYETQSNAQGRVVNERRIRATPTFKVNKLSFSPRLNWKLGDGASLAWQAVLDRSRLNAAGCEKETLLLGVSTEFPDNCFTNSTPVTALRSDVTWTRNLGPGKLVAKAAVNRNARESSFVFSDTGPAPTLVRSVSSKAVDNTTTLSGKYALPLGRSHSLGLGWDGGRTLRSEDRRQRDATPAGVMLSTLDEDYEATVDRMALYAQDEWSITPRLQAYLGLRWEGLRTDVSGSTMQQLVRNQSSVVSPVAQLLWKLPGTDKDQVRMSLSRSYKAPLTRLLVPRRYVNNNGNSPTNPDFSGNAQLRPELAWGLDGGYESYFGKDGVASVSGFVRRVEGVTLWQVVRDQRGWISTPSNKGNALVRGIEADAKFKPHRDVDVRANVAYNWSRLDTVPGPDNRLADQVALTFNAGFDYRASAAYTVGMNLNLQFSEPVQVDARERTSRAPARGLDLYALWKMSEHSKWRLSISDALQQDRITRRTYTDSSGVYDRRFVESSRMLVRLTLETRL